MSSKNGSNHTHKLSTAGLLVALGIVFGDIGTSPLYVFKAIVGDEVIDSVLVLGGLSLIIWTITLITSVKYIMLALQADNRGEGGIFALFTLVRRWNSWLIYPAMIGGCALLADGIITPCISVSSAIEGLRVINEDIPTVPLVLLILVGIFSLQQFGTKLVGSSFGPIITVWFTMLSVLGVYHLVSAPQVLAAINPYYAIKLLIECKNAYWILGAVFLCTTGAEALYSDLGHCGKKNIQASWIFVKIALILNYAGQSAWLLNHSGSKLDGVNPFFALMPEWFLLPGIIIATLAAIIASQALISGTFTLITEAIRLNLIPKLKVVYPTELRGQIYVPSVNFWMLIGCIGITLFFKESSNMEAAYGVAISIALIMTTVLLTYYLMKKRMHWFAVWSFFIVYLFIEASFLIANLHKFHNGGWVAVLVASSLFLVMWVWLSGTNIKKGFVEFEDLDKNLGLLAKLSKDSSISKFATHLVYLTEANKSHKIESKIIHSLFKRQPKRADVYWFLHVHVLDEPYAQEYAIKELIPGIAYRIDFKLGFRVEPRVSVLFRQVIQDMAAKGEVDIISRYECLREQKIVGDFRFIVSRKYLSADNDLGFFQLLIMKTYFYIKHIVGMKEAAGYGLDTSAVITESFPLILSPVGEMSLKRIQN